MQTLRHGRTVRPAAQLDTLPQRSLGSRLGRAPAPLLQLLALAVFALLTLGVWWMTAREQAAEELVEVESTETEPTRPESTPDLAPPVATDVEPGDQRTELEPESTEAAAPYALHRDESLERVRISGLVALPEGTPDDELPRVIAIDEARTHQILATSPSALEEALREDGMHHLLIAVTDVREDGSYDLDVPADRKVAHLALIGRYLAPLQTTRVEVSPDAEPPVLEAQLGAWITGRVVLPEGTDESADSFDAAEVELGPDVTGGFDAMSISSTAVEREADPDADGRFAMHALIEPGRKGILWRHDRYAGGLKLGLDPAPGEHLELELPFTMGGSVTGKVADDRGHPVEGAEVEIRYRGALGQMIGKLREAESDAQGGFALEHLPEGDYELRVEHPEWRTLRVDVEEHLAEGGRVDGVLVTLDAGASIIGKLSYPDGSPAEGARIEASFDYSAQVGGVSTTADPENGDTDHTDAGGHFELRGLSEGPFFLEATLDLEDGPHAGSWGLRRGGMKPSAEELSLVLEPLGTLEGEVVDHTGAPVSSFVARATLAGSGAMFGVGAERKVETVTDSGDGRFRLAGLRPGKWLVHVKAEGFARSTDHEASLPLPADAAPVRFELVPAAAVEGVVVDSLGEAVAGARVTVQLELAQRVKAQIEGESPPATFSDSEGRFLLEGLNPGPMALEALHELFASSEPVGVDLIAGETTSDITLALRTGGSITGLVLTAEGDPRPGRSVILQRMPSMDRQHVLESATDGSFGQEHLEPGSWRIVVMANVMTQGAEASTDEGVAQTLGDMIIETAEITEGQNTHIVLGLSDGRPIEVSGRVTHAGVGIGGSLVSFVPEDSESFGDLKMAVTNSEGHFTATLQRRGTWLVTVQNNLSTGRQNSIEFTERMPDDGDSHTMDLELPGGRITGRVVGPRGKPVAGCRITLNVEGGIAYGSFLGGHYTETVTDAEGHYEIQYLRAGRYAVAAGGPELGGMLGDDAAWGRTLRGDLEIGDGEWLQGIDFELDAPGDLQGVVYGIDNAPLEGAAIFVRDESGRMIERFSLVATDGRGAFTYRGLAPGRYTAFARHGGTVSESCQPFEVRSGSMASIELRLEEGCVVKVKVRDKSGANVRARVSIIDNDGREHTGAMSMSEIMEQFGNGFSSEEQRVGPLPLGRYHVRAIAEDGRETESKIRLSRVGERSVILRLK